MTQLTIGECVRENSLGLLMGSARLVSGRRDTLLIYSVTQCTILPAQECADWRRRIRSAQRSLHAGRREGVLAQARARRVEKRVGDRRRCGGHDLFSGAG